jgi:hypothetical protein
MELDQRDESDGDEGLADGFGSRIMRLMRPGVEEARQCGPRPCLVVLSWSILGLLEQHLSDFGRRQVV